MKVLLRAVLFLDALLNLLLGAVLLLSPFTTFYSALQLPQPQPPMYGQLLGVALVGLALLLWQATVNGQLTVAVARTVGQVNLASALLIVTWMLMLDLPVQGAGKIWLPVLAAVMAFFAAVQIPAAKRVRVRERAQRELQKETQNKDAGAAPLARRPQSPEYRREPGVTPPPGYGPGTEVMPEPVPDETPSAHHARQNPNP
ncbi:membrane protein [Burkholderiaceae bacterium 16]|nr:membrane protein [Burkholderiaceae bacterium 16]